MNVKGTEALGGSSTQGSYWNKKLGDAVEVLPEAEVEEINGGTGTGTDDSGWFYQDTSGSDTSNDNWYTQENNVGSGETAYNEIYYSPETPQYDTSYSSGSTQKTEQSALQNAIEQPTVNPEPETNAEKEANAYVNAVLGQQANTRPGPVANQNSSLVSPVFDEDAIKRSIQQSIDQANAEANVNAQQANVQNAQNMQNLLEWDWRNGTPPTPQTVQTRGGNLALPPNYRATDSNSGTSMLQEYVPYQEQQNPSLLERILNIGVTPAYAENEMTSGGAYLGNTESDETVPITKTYGDWRDNLQLAPQVLHEETAPVEQNTEPVQGRATISPQEMAQLLNDPTARQLFSAAKADGETDTNAALFALNQTNYLKENPRYNTLGEALAGSTENARNNYRAVQEETAGQNTLYGNRLYKPETAIDNWVNNGGLDQASQQLATLKNLGVQSENQQRINETVEALALADGLDPKNLTMEQRNAYEQLAETQTKLVEETTPEYQKGVIESRIASDNAAKEGVAKDLANLVGLSSEEQRNEQQRMRNENKSKMESQIEDNNITATDLTDNERNYGSGAYAIPGYTYEGNMNPTLQSVIAGERSINQVPEGRPGYNADGTPNDMLKALLNGEYIPDASIGELATIYPEHYETLRRANSDGMLALFDATYGQSLAGFEGITIPDSIKDFIASSSGKSMGQLETGFIDGNGNLQILSNKDIEYVKASGADYDKAIDTLIGANKVLQDMISAGLVTKDDIARHFFKGLSETKEADDSTKKSYSGGGGGKSSSKKSYSSGGRSGGGYSSGSGYAYAPNDKEQRQARVNNIMKNWTF